jgi:anthranilate synthase/aminodeoxychorismate synthase-like glutamine amidotransferase
VVARPNAGAGGALHVPTRRARYRHAVRPSVLLVDCFDSFTWNLVQAFRVLGATVIVRRSDCIDRASAERIRTTHVVLSPGPGRPDEVPVLAELVHAFLGRRPILGVCLGHQALATALGGSIVPARELVHGKAREVLHDGRGLFAELPSPLPCGRYHSLAVGESDLPAELQVTARAPDGDIMALAHRTLPAWGVQFHPESILTPDGPGLLARFLAQ